MHLWAWHYTTVFGVCLTMMALPHLQQGLLRICHMLGNGIEVLVEADIRYATFCQ